MKYDSMNKRLNSMLTIFLLLIISMAYQIISTGALAARPRLNETNFIYLNNATAPISTTQNLPKESEILAKINKNEITKISLAVAHENLKRVFLFQQTRLNKDLEMGRSENTYVF